MNKIVFLSELPPTLPLTEKQVIDLIENSVSIFGINNKIIEIWFVSIDKITELNNQYRNIDKPTDVLSFPQTQIDKGGEEILGSIVINLEMVIEKNEKLDDVIKHGLLHLIGFDHENDTDLSAWENAANKINCEL